MSRTILWAVVIGVGVMQIEARAQPVPAAAPAAADAREADVRQFVEGYFRSWSQQDMNRYARCFMPQAAVQVIDPAGRLGTMPVGPFLKSQKLAHKEAKSP